MTPNIFVVTDLGYGDSGKGTIVDALVREYNADLVVRYNGGAQAAHNVVAPDGREHTFNQFGSGTLVNGVKTFLSRYMLVNPLALIWEEEKLRRVGVSDAFDRLYVDDNAIVTTPYHVYANRIKEYARNRQRHGSCGMGIGETASDAINYPENTLYVHDLFNVDKLVSTLRWIRAYKQKQLEFIIKEIPTMHPIPDLILSAINLLSSEDELEATIEVFGAIAKRIQIADEDFLKNYLQTKTVVFEGSQGVLLDEDWGFYPYTTWSKTTPTNALTLIEEAGCSEQATVIGVIRAYTTRHGVGPFVTENTNLCIPDSLNKFNMWQEEFRVGWFDAVAIRYAIAVSERVDSIAVTCLDRLEEFPVLKMCYAYDCDNLSLDEYREAQKYFEIEDNIIYDIKVNKPVDLKHQERLGCILGKLKPIYKETKLGHKVMPNMIKYELNIPISITSWGQKYTDKIFGKK